MKRRVRLFLLLPAFCALAIGGVAADVDIETRARAIEGRIMAPCCRANTVAEHYSPVAAEIRAEIREQLRAGESQEQILAFYAAKYGDQVLAMPEASGFNLVAWLVPMVFLLVGPGLIFLVLRGWKAKSPPEPAATEPAAEIDPEYARRLQASLAKLD